MRLNWSSARRHLSLLMVAVSLLIMLLALTNKVSGEHALSEVWSEADGLQMKYSTDHDDLLSTKGSELSLQTHNAPNNKHEATGESQQQQSHEESSGGSGETAAASSGGLSPPEAESGSPESSNEHSSSESHENGEGNGADEQSSPTGSANSMNGEQGADSSRQTDRIPMNKHYSTSNKQSAFLEPAARYRSSLSQSSSSSSDDSEHSGSSRARSGKPARQSLFTSTNSGNDDETPGSFEAVQAASNDDGGSETANVDHGDDSVDGPLGESPNPKFKAPGRLFKEAVRMSSPAASASKASADENEAANQDDSDDSSSSSSAKQRSNTDSNSATNNDEAPSSPIAAGEPEFTLSNAKPAQTFRGRQKMIDFDNLVEAKQRSGASQSSSAAPADEPEEVVNVDNEEKPASEFGSSDIFRRNNQQRGRSQLAESVANSERDSPFSRPDSFFDQSSQRAVTAANSSPAQKERLSAVAAAKSRYLSGSANNQAISGSSKQALPYLRSLSGDQQQQGRRFLESSGVNSASTSAAAAAPESPDSVRDNFISPGHYPGSMAHLTQAASELQKQQLAGKAAAINSPDPKTSDLTISASSASVAAVSGSSSSQQLATTSADGRMTGMLQQVTVTPEPDAQPESQQIMAPILMSTTTMAPMASTASTELISSSSSSSTTTTSTTTAAPTLERFKFRKYR